jgi:hypothetical protein
MRRANHSRPSRRRVWATTTLAGLIVLPALAHEPGETIDDPGFMPDRERQAAFIEQQGTVSVVVLPTILRRAARTGHSMASQEQITRHFNKSGIANASSKPWRIDLGSLRRPSQWEIFQASLRTISAEIEQKPVDADFVAVLELLFPADDSVFGIHVFVLDPDGGNVFSFLLNSHHQLFAKGELTAEGTSQSARQALVERATAVALEALDAQIAFTRECLDARAVRLKAEPGIVHDFESELERGTGRYESPLGFSTFTDGPSTVTLERTNDYPPMPAADTNNHVLRVDMDVQSWAGFVYLFSNEETNTWSAVDWRAADGMSFWFHGNATGTTLFVDVLDNRAPCSRRDDAERYSLSIVDDTEGWRLVSGRFRDMRRKEIGNDAPNDGLGLAEIHGWALGALSTGGPASYYLDDVRLWADDDNAATITHPFFIETPLDAMSSALTVDPDRFTGLAAENAMTVACACADLTVSRGFNYYSTDERTTLADGRARFRIRFYETPPDGLPVLDRTVLDNAPAPPGTDSAVLDAREFVSICKALVDSTAP